MATSSDTPLPFLLPLGVFFLGSIFVGSTATEVWFGGAPLFRSFHLVDWKQVVDPAFNLTCLVSSSQFLERAFRFLLGPSIFKEMFNPKKSHGKTGKKHVLQPEFFRCNRINSWILGAFKSNHHWNVRLDCCFNLWWIQGIESNARLGVMTCEATTRMAIGGLAPGGLGPSNPATTFRTIYPVHSTKKTESKQSTQTSNYHWFTVYVYL